MKRIMLSTSAAALLAAGVSIAVANSGSPGSEALEQANSDMHKAMSVTMTGDVDVDFVRSMIPHHQGAVDMAKIVLEYGKDPEIRKLAEEIVQAQETEIAFMKSWLEKNGAAATNGSGMEMDHTDH